MARENDSQFTQISPSMSITGDLTGSSDLRIAGKIKGNIATTGDVVIEESGYVEGTIKTKNATIAGKVSGDIECSEKVVLEAKSLTIGNLKAKLLVIQCGAKLKGNCDISVETETKKS